VASFANGWAPPGITLNPGEGAFLQSPTNFSLTFTGTPHVPVLPVIIPAGQTYLLSRQTAATATPEQIVGTNLPPGAKVWQWTGSGYRIFTFDEFDLTWQPATPSVAVGESVWIAPAGGSLPPNPPPFITQVPRSLSVPVGSNAVFSVVLSTASSATVQWFKEFTAIPPSTTFIFPPWRQL